MAEFTKSKKKNFIHISFCCTMSLEIILRVRNGEFRSPLRKQGVCGALYAPERKAILSPPPIQFGSLFYSPSSFLFLPFHAYYHCYNVGTHIVPIYPRLDVWWDHARRRKEGGGKRHTWEQSLGTVEVFLLYCLRTLPMYGTEEITLPLFSFS